MKRLIVAAAASVLAFSASFAADLPMRPVYKERSGPVHSWRHVLPGTFGPEVTWRYGWSLMAKFDGEFASGAQTYAGTARLRYTW